MGCLDGYILKMTWEVRAMVVAIDAISDTSPSSSASSTSNPVLYSFHPAKYSTYDHRTLNIELPVRSAVLKQCTGGLVPIWVTDREFPLLYVFCTFCSRKLR
ncbi:hypothetical protein P153DRAFT_224131 [Dothidotthia symphoricarpi CBS 119687]|uniref:Uncharacterized protein n=1 Tax=Dothidotthia symphoricarpi CBS 119687 TaxID=1392245 RepID=A0A6A6AEP5_9PLEO|nr:uncharacterized protein P153DRAFT_224131 [Dothidotthia symphoricarpi CBS 119687]KAF2129783.1 hypothetical protein P153DRAFT_224131 [Dothidotthia symphoricarpi CBS 119687]